MCSPFFGRYSMSIISSPTLLPSPLLPLGLLSGNVFSVLVSACWCRTLICMLTWLIFSESDFKWLFSYYVYRRADDTGHLKLCEISELGKYLLHFYYFIIVSEGNKQLTAFRFWQLLALHWMEGKIVPSGCCPLLTPGIFSEVGPVFPLSELSRHPQPGLWVL